MALSPRHVLRVRVYVSTLSVVSGVAGCAERRAASPDEARTVVTTRSGDFTDVSITEGATISESPACRAYCERMAECWGARPNADVLLGKDEVVARCRRERSECRVPPTQAFCCAETDDCQEFVRCDSASRDVVVTDCPRAGAH